MRASATFHGGTWQLGALLVESPGQRGEAEFAQHLAHGGGAQWRVLLLERFGDFVHRMIAFAQELWFARRTSSAGSGSARGGEEERGLGVAAEVVAQHANEPSV